MSTHGGKRETSKIKHGICEICGATIEKRGVGKMPRYCSSKCKSKSYLNTRGITKNCENCGNEYKTLRNDAQYCSYSCSAKVRAQAFVGRKQYQKTCSRCGKKYNTEKSNQKYCSKECACKAVGENQRKFYRCEHCGMLFSGTNASRQIYCNRNCAMEARKIRTDIKIAALKAIEPVRYKRHCIFCDAEFETIFSGKLTCSSECAYKQQLLKKREEWAEAYEPRIYTCKWCGEAITTTCGDKRREFCCQGCAHKAERSKNHKTLQHKLHKRQHSKRRDALMTRGFVEQVRYKDVYKRDDGKCQICGMPVPKDKLVDDYWGGTIDHIVPLSKGGLHSMSNCQLAHRICNSLKSDEVGQVRIDWKKRSQIDRYWMLIYERGLGVISREKQFDAPISIATTTCEFNVSMVTRNNSRFQEGY